MIDCCARHFLSQQPDFFTQKCEIEELINDWHSHQYRVLFYPKFHCELNHIEHFWAHAKRYARDRCDYTLEGLRIRVPEALKSVKNHTILGHYKGCLKKMDLYRQGINYGTTEWQTLASHQKPKGNHDDR